MTWALLVLLGALQRAPQPIVSLRDAVDTSATIASLLAADSALAAEANRRGAAAVLEAFEPEAAMRQLLDFIGSRPLVGYFLEFDVAMVNREIWPMLGVRLPQRKFEVSALVKNLGDQGKFPVVVCNQPTMLASIWSIRQPGWPSWS